jgi:hypothetical protein
MAGRKVITLCAKNIGQKFINVAKRCYRRKHQRAGRLLPQERQPITPEQHGERAQEYELRRKSFLSGIIWIRPDARSAAKGRPAWILYRPVRLVSGGTQEEKVSNDDIAGIIPYLPVSGQMKGVKRAPGQAYQT